MPRELNEVGVVGLGTMGAGIAEVFARAGLSVVAVDVDDAAVQRGRGHLEKSTGRAVSRGRLDPADRDAVLARIRFTTSMDDLAGAELVVEAVPERMDLKAPLLSALDRICPPHTVLATNTSSLSVTELAVASGRPGRVVGMHFFNPAPVMKLVEVVRTVVTEPSVVSDVEALATRLGKVPVVIGDRAGFVANHLLFGYLNAAVAMVDRGHASREDVDLAMRLGCGLPMGPLALLDLIGIDTAYEILATMYRQSGDRLHAPNPLLTQLATAGRLGRKTGRGFYRYAGPHTGEVVPDEATPVAGAAGKGARPAGVVCVVGVVGSGHGSGELDEVAAAIETAGFPVAVVLAELGPEGAAQGLRWVGEPEVLAAADLVLVTGAETADGVRTVFGSLGELTRPGAVLATASGRPVVEAAAASGRPGDVVGLHLHGSPPRLAEVVAAITTAPDAAATVHAFVDRLGVPAVRSGDRAGAIVQALLVPYLNDAVRLVEAGYAGADDVDAAMTLGCGYPIGPLAQLDTLGLDVALAAQRRLYAESGEPGLVPAPLLAHLVTAGHLGRAAGRGFRDHAAR